VRKRASERETVENGTFVCKAVGPSNNKTGQREGEEGGVETDRASERERENERERTRDEGGGEREGAAIERQRGT